MDIGGQRVPAMQSVLLEVRGGRLRMVTATLARARGRAIVDGEARGRELPVRIAADGEMLVPALLLAKLAHELKGFGGPVLLEGQTQTVMAYGYTTSKYQRVEVPREEHQLEVRATRYGFVAHLVGRDAEEYPPIYQDIDLGDWGHRAPVARVLVAA
jgi:hypothetical protein